jgi:hypothetical protein
MEKQEGQTQFLKNLSQRVRPSRFGNPAKSGSFGNSS